MANGRLIRLLLAMVVCMMVAAAGSLFVAHLQAEQLAEPNQHNDLWHVVNLETEIEQLRQAATQPASHTTADDLRLRLDVLLSLLKPGSKAPQNSTGVLQQIPEAEHKLMEVAVDVQRWSDELDNSADAATVQALSREIVAAAPALLERCRRMVVDVHVATAEKLDADRQQQRHRYVLLSWTMGGLVLGTLALVVRLLFETRRADRIARHFEALNKRLECRVKHRTRQLAEGKALLMFILDASPSEVALVDANDGTVHFVNQRFLDRLGIEAENLKQLQLRQLIADEARGQQFIGELEQYGRVDGWEAKIAAPEPYWSAMSAQLIEVEGKLAHLLWCYDISPHKALEANLRTLASTDMLSGLNNRRAFFETGAQLVNACREARNPCALLMLDIDHFKRINDSYGHAAGDAVIRATALLLQSQLRDIDLLGRIGGEEFAVLLPQTNRQQAERTAERIRHAISLMPFHEGGSTLHCTVSIGVALLAPVNGRLEQMMLAADEALYDAKAAGRNRVASASANPTTSKPHPGHELRL